MSNKMKGSSWVILECIIVLTVLGIASFFVKPHYELGVGMIIAAIIGVLNQIAGVKSGSSMPDQATDRKPGQTSELEIKTTAPVPKEEQTK
jgi:hypothetical protein